MIYLPSDTLFMHINNADNLIRQIADPLQSVEGIFQRINFLMQFQNGLSLAQQRNLHKALVLVKWNPKYVYDFPHNFVENPGAYADAVLCYGYYQAKYLRDKEITNEATDQN